MCNNSTHTLFINASILYKLERTKSPQPQKHYKLHSSQINMTRKNYSYNDYSDSLIISMRQENEKTAENFMTGDIVFSLNSKGKIVSIEIMEISSFLESCNINPEILNNIHNISFEVVVKRDSLFIVIKIEGFENNNLLKATVPMVVPMTN